MSTCRECGGPISWVARNGRNVPTDEDGGGDHMLTCASDAGRRRRIRAGKEPGFFAVSPSAIDLFRKCKLAYKRRYILNEPEPQGEAGDLGRWVHVEIAAKLRSEDRPEGLLVPLGMVKDYRQIMNSFERQRENGLWMTEDASIEEKRFYRWKDASGLEVELMAIIDYWLYEGDRAVVTDWKTGFEIEAAWQLVKDVQANINALVLAREYPQLLEVRFQQVHFRFGGEVVGHTFTRDHINAFELALRAEVAAMIAEEHFEANPFCTVCPVGAHPMAHYPVKVGTEGEFQIRPPGARDEAENLEQYVFAAERLVKAGKEALRGWTAENGALPGGLGHHAITSRSIDDVAAAIEVLKDNGYEDLLHEFVGFNGTKLKAILESKRKWVSLAAELTPLLVTKTETRYEFRPPKEEAPAQDVASQ